MNEMFLYIVFHISRINTKLQLQQCRTNYIFFFPKINNSRLHQDPKFLIDCGDIRPIGYIWAMLDDPHKMPVLLDNDGMFSLAKRNYWTRECARDAL